MATELAQAYVQIMPSAQGISGSLSKMLGGEATSAGLLAGGNLGSALMKGVAALGVGKALKDSLTAGAEFDTAMSQVAATMLKPMEELKEEIGTVELDWGTFSGNLRDYAMEMGAKTQFSATQAAEALNYMALAGYDVQTSMEMLPNVMNLAAAGAMDLATASDMITDTQTAFGLSLERTSLMVDEMAKAASTGNTSVEQLGDAFLVIGGLAQELNGGFVDLGNGIYGPVDGTQELTIALTAMANAGIKGSEAGTHMRNMLLKLSDPTSDGVDQLKALGVAVFDDEEQMRSLSDIMGDLSNELGNLTQEKQIQAIGDLFNTRDMASAKALLNAVKGEFVQVGEEIYSVDEAYEKWGDDIYDSSKGFEYVRTSWDEIGASVLDAMWTLEDVQGAIEGSGVAWDKYGADVAGNMGQLSENVRHYMTSMGLSAEETAARIAFEWGISMEDAAAAVGAVETAMDGVLGSAGEMASIQNYNLAGDIKLFKSAVEGAQIAISDGLAPTLRSFTQMGTTLLSDFAATAKESGIGKAIVTTIQSIPMEITKMLRMAANNIKENGTAIFEEGAALAGELITGLVTSVPYLLEAGFDLAAAIGSAIMNTDWLGIAQEFASTFKNDMSLALGEAFGIDTDDMGIVSGIINGVMSKIPEWIETAGSLVTQFVGFVLEKAPDLLSAGVELLGNLVMGIINSLPELVSSAITVVSGFLGEVAKHLPDILKAGGEILGKIVAGIINAIPKLIRAALKIISTVAEKITSTDWLALGKDIVLGIRDGIVAFAGKVKDAISDMVKGAWDSVKDFFGIKSPSKLMYYAGEMVDLGFAKGIAGHTGEVTGAMRSMMDAARKEISDEMLIGTLQNTSFTGTTGAGRTAAGGYTQNITINAPQALSASEVARQTRNATQNMVLALSLG